MSYYCDVERELEQLGIQHGEMAIYLGTPNPRRPDSLGGTEKRHSYVYLWYNGKAVFLNEDFRNEANTQILGSRTKGSFAILRDWSSGYVRQISGPAQPLTIVNIGAIPLRVDTFLGKFTVYAGSGLRLDESAPQREKKKVLLTLGSRYVQPLRSAECWDSGSHRRLNIRRYPSASGNESGLAVLDGSAIVQYMSVNSKGEIFMMDSPEPDPDYEIRVMAEAGIRTVLRFNRTDYQNGQVVQRVRTVGKHHDSVIYDLRKLRESSAQSEVDRGDAEWSGTADLPAEEKTDSPPQRRRRLIDSEKLQKFLDSEDPVCEAPPGSDEMGAEHREERHGDGSAVLRGPEPDGQKTPAPEPPENFPK